MDNIYDTIIIGSGPAGMTAAIYASRAGLKTLILEMSAPGGKMVKTHLVENYPSIESITGVDLSMKMHSHSVKFGAEYGYGDVDNIEKKDDLFYIHVAHDETFIGRAVIVATGSNEKKLNLPLEEKLTGRGISYCAVCDGAFYRDKEVIVIGGGNSALEESIYLTQFASKVTIVIRRDVFRADQVAQDKIKKEPKIQVITKHIPEAIVEENGMVSGLKIKHVETGEITLLPGSAIFPYVGSVPATSFLSNFDVLDASGSIIVNEKMETAVKGLYGAGDVVVKKLRQIVTATNDGAIAAQNIFHYLRG